jgi:hypothetical protein
MKILRFAVITTMLFSAQMVLSQTVYTFTNCAATGRFGPTQSQVNAEYGSTNNLYNSVTSNSGVQYWTVPVTGDYSIEAYGAQGGGNGGLGAKVSGEFSLTSGQVIRVVVGQQGVDGTGGSTTNNGGGGGGASYVIQSPYNTNASILAIAGGGGGGVGSTAGGNGLSGNDGGDIYNNGGGTAGAGGGNGETNGEAAGGGGFFSNGQNSANTSQNPCQGGLGFNNGSTGGESGTNNVYFGGHGGFGGGGSGWHNSLNRCGGGGGYSGGQGGTWSSNPAGPGGGGGSYNTGTSQVNTTGVNSGHGYVVITQLYGVSISETTSLDCYGDNDAVLLATGNGGATPYTYLWSTSATSQSITGLTAGTYTVTMTDNNSQTTVDTYTITEPTELEATAAADSNVSCNGGNDGGATVSVSGGTTSYAYLWSNSATTATITGVGSATYTVTVTDANGCTDVASATITQPTAISASATNTNVSCNGLNDGTATASATGGTGTLTYLWSNGSTSASATSLVASTYTVTVTDANGCTTTTSTTVTQPAVLSVSLSNTNVLCYGGNTGSIASGTTGGTATYGYLWSNGSTNDTATTLVAGTYTLTVTDNNGCTAVESSTVSEPTELTSADSVVSNVACYGGDQGIGYVSVTGGTSSYGYLWNTGDTTSMIDSLIAGTYVVTIVDANGCELLDSFNISEPTQLVLTMSLPTAIICFGDSTSSTSISAMGGIMPYSYEWSNDSTDTIISGLGAGNYIITVTDSNGCMMSDTAVVLGPDQAIVASIIVDQEIVCAGDLNGALTANATGGWGNFNFVWNNSQTSASITALSEGMFAVTITDSLGCEVNVSDSLMHQNENPTVDLGGDTLVCQGTIFSLDAGNAGSTYSWTTGETSQTIEVSTSGTFGVDVTSEAGCIGSNSIEVVVDSCLGINELTTAQIKVYPNPSQGGVIYIAIDGVKSNDSYIQMIDLTGKVVAQQQQFKSDNGVIEFNINQPSGIYFLRISTNNQVFTERVIVQ